MSKVASGTLAHSEVVHLGEEATSVEEEISEAVEVSVETKEEVTKDTKAAANPIVAAGHVAHHQIVVADGVEDLSYTRDMINAQHLERNASSAGRWDTSSKLSEQLDNKDQAQGPTVKKEEGHSHQEEVQTVRSQTKWNLMPLTWSKFR